jgi:hypothetical protein
MPDPAQECFEAAFAYAFRVYGGERPGSDKEKCRQWAEQYARRTVEDAHGRSAAERLRIIIEHQPGVKTPSTGPFLR